MSKRHPANLPAQTALPEGLRGLDADSVYGLRHIVNKSFWLSRMVGSASLMDGQWYEWSKRPPTVVVPRLSHDIGVSYARVGPRLGVNIGPLYTHGRSGYLTMPLAPMQGEWVRIGYLIRIKPEEEDLTRHP